MHRWCYAVAAIFTVAVVYMAASGPVSVWTAALPLTLVLFWITILRLAWPFVAPVGPTIVAAAMVVSERPWRSVDTGAAS
jgi:hypothetical protein